MLRIKSMRRVDRAHRLGYWPNGPLMGLAHKLNLCAQTRFRAAVLDYFRGRNSQEKMCDEGFEVDFEDELFAIKVEEAEQAFVDVAAAAVSKPVTPPGVKFVTTIPAFRKPVKRSLSHELELAAAEGRNTRARCIDLTGDVVEARAARARGRVLEVDVTGDEIVFVYQ